MFFSDDTVYIWEIKPNNEKYGRVQGPLDLQRYVTNMRSHLEEMGDDREVMEGAEVERRRFVSSFGPGAVWSEKDEPGMRYYGLDRRTPSPTPAPTVLPTARPQVTQQPTPEATPSATGTYGAPQGSGSVSPETAGKFGLAAMLGWAFKSLASGIGQGPACALGGAC
jgi:hypothetical protein